MKALEWLWRESLALAAGYFGVVIWGFLVLGLLGYAASELNVVLRLSLLLPLLFFVERFAGIWFRSMITRHNSVAAGVGFIIYASYANVFMKMVYENPYAGSNIRDLVLIGLVMGIPSGLLVHKLGDFARRVAW